MVEIDFDEFDFRKVHPIKLPFAEKYIHDIDYIFFADTGIWDARQTNMFFQEAGRMLVNAIHLFCKGYFDCAFYCLRQSFEISVTSLYLNGNKDIITQWNKRQNGFEQNNMVKSLKKQSDDYKELREGVLKAYFDWLRTVMEKMNKYIHKQGFSTMYTMRYSFEGRKIYKEEKLINFFIYCLKACIGAVAVWRIVLDPMPALLNDKTIFRKTSEMCTEPYSDEFIDEYIGREVFEQYKQSMLYQEYYRHFNQFEEQNEAIFNIIHYQVINRNDIDGIWTQMHLLSIQERVAVLFVILSNHIVRVIFGNGTFCYSSELRLNGGDQSITYGNGVYDEYFQERDINQVYKSAYISRFITEIQAGAGRKKALTLQEIGKIVRFSDGNETTERYRDLCFFMYLCNGINTADLVKLKYKNIHDGEICFVRQKTERTNKTIKEICEPITPEMETIIKRWGNEPLPDNLIFPYLEGVVDPIKRKHLTKDLTRRINKRMKRIGQALGIENITTYTARHSFATVLKRSGANISYISESLGHSDLKTMEAYLASFEKEERQKNASLLTQF